MTATGIKNITTPVADRAVLSRGGYGGVDVDERDVDSIQRAISKTNLELAELRKIAGLKPGKQFHRMAEKIARREYRGTAMQAAAIERGAELAARNNELRLMLADSNKNNWRHHVMPAVEQVFGRDGLDSVIEKAKELAKDSEVATEG